MKKNIVNEMSESNGEFLLKELISDPIRFNNRGGSFYLLQEYLLGLPHNTLIPLLKSDNIEILRPAMFIASELGSSGADLLPHMVLLVNNEEALIRYYAFECILLWASGKQIKEFVHLIKRLNSEEDILRSHIMLLLSKADRYQLSAAIKLITSQKIDHYQLHQEGVRKLLSADNLDDWEVLKMLDSDHTLTQQYGAMIAGKVYKNRPNLIEHALSSSNQDVQGFAKEILDLN